MEKVGLANLRAAFALSVRGPTPSICTFTERKSKNLVYKINKGGTITSGI